MKHLLSILILLGFMSVANAGWFFTSDEEYVENCVDSHFIEKLNISIDTSKKAILNAEPEYGYCDPSCGKIENYYDENGNKTINWACSLDCGQIIKTKEAVIKVYEEKISNYEKELEIINSESLQEKLKEFKGYESRFKYCSNDMRTDEVTFKAKWK